MIDGARADRIPNGKNFKKIINKSCFFSKVITYAPYTIAALHAVFSGTYGNKTGVNSYWSSPNFKKNHYKSLALYLKENGFYTYADVINNLVIPKIGFDKFIVHDEENDDLTLRHKNIITNLHKNNENSDFFLYLHYSKIHTGIMQNVLKKYDNFSEEYFKNRNQNEIFYDQLFSQSDDYLGSIMSHCETLGLLKNTLVVIISDHGISIGEKLGERAYGVYCYDYTLCSNALFYHQSISQSTINQQVRSVDLLPTILEILKIPQDPKFKSIDGFSLIPMMKGNYIERTAFSQSGNPLHEELPPKQPNVSSIRTNKWKLIKNHHDQTEELYDLENDPNEENNLINLFHDITNKLRNELNNNLEVN